MPEGMTVRRTLLAVMSAALVAVGLALPAAATPTPVPAASWVANGTVWTTATIGDTVYLGGSFGELSPATGGGIVLDPGTGVRDETQPQVAGTVRAAAAAPAGGWYLGGSFTSVAGVSRGGLAVVKADGTLGGWNPKAVGGQVAALALSPDAGTLYVGGTFTSIKGQPRAGLASFATATNSLTSWAPTVTGGGVVTIAPSTDGSTVFVGGSFTGIGGTARSHVAALDPATGAVSSSWNPGADGQVLSLLATGSAVYAGGTFASLGGSPRANVGAVDPATGAPVVWTGTGTNGTVRALGLVGTDLAIGGTFSSLDGEGRSNLGTVDTSTGEVKTWSPAPDGAVTSLLVDGGGATVFAGGDFLSAGGQPARRLAALDAVTGLADPGIAPNPNATVRTLASDGTSLYAGGAFTGAGGVLRDNLGAIDATTGAATGWNPGADKTVYALAASPDGSTVYAGGVFGMVGGLARSRLAAIDASTGAIDASFSVTASRRVRSLATAGDLLYVGGEFRKLGGESRAFLGAVGISTGKVDAGWVPLVDGMVRTLLPTPDGRVYVGGDFDTVDGGDRDHLAAVDATSGALVTSFVPDWPRYRTFEIATDGTRLFAAMGGPGGGRLRAYRMSDGNLAWEAAADGDVQACTYADGVVYIGGHFDVLLGAKRGSLGAADATSGALDPWSPGANGSLWSLSTAGTRIVAAGAFTRMGTTVREGVALFA